MTMNFLSGAIVVLALGIVPVILFFYDGDRVAALGGVAAFVGLLITSLRTLQVSDATDKKVEQVHTIVNSQRTAMQEQIDRQVAIISEFQIALNKVEDALVRSQTQSAIKTETINTQAGVIADHP